MSTSYTTCSSSSGWKGSKKVFLQGVALPSFRKEAKGIVHFLARSEKTNQKRGATPKAPYIGGCNRSSCRSFK